MPVKRKSVNTEGYKAKLRTIRPYVNFDYNLNKKLTSSEKRKIDKYYKEISKLKGQTRQFVKPTGRHPSDREHQLRQLLKAGDQSGLKELKGAFLQTDGSKTKVEFDKYNRPLLKTEHVTQGFIPFDQKALARDPDAEVDRALGDTKYPVYKIAAGEYEIVDGLIRRSVNAQVKRLMAKYDGHTILPGRSAARARNQNWRNWLNGVNFYKFTSQGDYREYDKEKTASIKKNKERAAARSKAARERARRKRNNNRR